MNELQRQRYLKQMGFTPWVAVTSLPGAAPSLVPEWPLEQQAPMERVAPDTLPELPGQAPVSLGPVSETRQATQPVVVKADTAPRETADAPSIVFTLQAHRGAQIHVWVEQLDAQAPSLSRDELQLFSSLMAVLGGKPQADARRLVCAPSPGRPISAELARPMFQAFARGVLGKEDDVRLLLCAGENTVKALFNTERFQPVMLGVVRCLPISSLAEMLASPEEHKRQSWQAMLAHGFYD
jgi:hypothetical protein